MRNRTLPTLLAACLTLALAVAVAPGAGAVDDRAQDPVAAPVDFDAPAPAQAPSLACPATFTVEPVFLAQPAAQTCEECQADCDAQLADCSTHCDRLCFSCLNKYYKCLDNCPC